MLILLQRQHPHNTPPSPSPPPTGANGHSTREDAKLSGTISRPSRVTSRGVFVPSSALIAASVARRLRCCLTPAAAAAAVVAAVPVVPGLWENPAP